MGPELITGFEQYALEGGMVLIPAPLPSSEIIV
jgi:hypothetical protein